MFLNREILYTLCFIWSFILILQLDFLPRAPIFEGKDVVSSDGSSIPKPKSTSCQPRIKVRSKCGDCGKIFSTNASLAIHIAGVHENRYRCSKCDRMYGSRSGLYEHERQHQDGFEKKFICGYDDCRKSFSGRSQLETHLCVKHTNHKRYKCDNNNCQRTYANMYAYLQHMKKCGSTGRMPCGECTASFDTPSARKEHRWAKHPKPHQKHTCLCGKVYMWRPSLARHKKTCTKWLFMNGFKNLSCWRYFNCDGYILDMKDDTWHIYGIDTIYIFCVWYVS